MKEYRLEYQVGGEMVLEFAPSFAGDRILYLAARDNTDTINSGWQPMGSWTVQ